MNSTELEQNFSIIQKMYLEENQSSQAIADFFKSKRGQINYLLKKHNIQKNSSEVKRKYTLDEHFFDKIDTQNKAYILGFLYADGYNNPINNSIVLSLSLEDKDTLEKIRKAIGTNKPLYDYSYVSNFDGKERKMTQLILCGKQISSALYNHGVVYNKTFSLQFPTLSEELYSHFIRGYFDGDGCFSIVKDDHKTLGYRGQCTIMSSTQFSEDLCKKLNSLDIHFHCNLVSQKENNRLIRTSDRKEIKKFFDYIYKDADLYMERKHNRFIEFFNMFNID